MPDTTHHFYSKLTCRYNFQNYSGLRVPQLFRGLLRVQRNFSEGENELKSESNEELPIKADSFFFFFMLLFLLYFFFFSFLFFSSLRHFRWLKIGVGLSHSKFHSTPIVTVSSYFLLKLIFYDIACTTPT